jgi:hypothetical protein
MCSSYAAMTRKKRGVGMRRAYDARVRGTLAGLLWIAACYTPSIAPGVPCSTDGLCPEGQICVAAVCVIPGQFDAAIDTVLPDKDNDGVPDMMDNCPDDPNPDQANEDGDKFGDACDPCPPFKNDNPSDPDKDGVADICDPNPMQSGDRIELFEGFHHGIPGWTRTANWTATGDSIEVAAAAGSKEYLVVPITGADRLTVWASVVVKSVAAAPAHILDVSVPNDTVNNAGISCEFYQPADETLRYLSLWDGFLLNFEGKEFGSAILKWATDTEYVMSLNREGAVYKCSVTDAGGAVTIDAKGTSSSTTAQPTAVIRAGALTARINWIMVVRSP